MIDFKRPANIRITIFVGLFLFVLAPQMSARGQEANGDPKANVRDKDAEGRLFQIGEPFRTETVEDLQARIRQYLEGQAKADSKSQPILLFEISSRGVRPGQTTAGVAQDLAQVIARDSLRFGNGARNRVAYVSSPLSGYAVIAALACDEIAMGPDAALGPILPPDAALSNEDKKALASTIVRLSGNKAADENLVLGMLSPNEDLRRVRTDDRRYHFVFAKDLEEFKKSHRVEADEPVWEGADRGILTAKSARDLRLSAVTVADSSDLARAYRLRDQATLDDPTVGRELKPLWFEISSEISPPVAERISRDLAKARGEQVNFVVFEINSKGGVNRAADDLAATISGLEGIKTVAYVNPEAVNAAVMVALACDEIVIRKGGRIGDFHAQQQRRNGRGQQIDPREIEQIAARLAAIAEKERHSPALARAMVDPSADLVDARDNQTGVAVVLDRADAQKDAQRYTILGDRKPAGRVLTMEAEEAAAVGLAVKVVESDEEFSSYYGLNGKAVQKAAPTWVDSLVNFLNTPFMSGALLFIGLFMLVVEIKLPGIGLPAILSTLAFILFFWSHYLGGTANQLEVILFLVGMICLGLELFVFPGVAVFGISGVVLILSSVVMASHTFIWASQDSEVREMSSTMIRIVGALLGVAIGAVILGRYFPSLPLFNRMILKPETEEEALAGSGIPGSEDLGDVGRKSISMTTSHAELLALVGERGRSSTPLRPSGKARFGEMLLDVTADGAFIDPNTAVEVIEIRGAQVVVKRV